MNQTKNIVIFLLLFANYSWSQRALSPRLTSSAQTCATYCDGIDAIACNPAILAIQDKDTTFNIEVAKVSKKNIADSLFRAIQTSFYIDSLYINLKIDTQIVPYKEPDSTQTDSLSNLGFTDSLAVIDTLSIEPSPEPIKETFTYKIHVVSSTSKEDARLLARLLFSEFSKESLFPMINVVESGSLFSVYINKLNTREDASFYLKLLKKTGYKSTYMDSIPAKFDSNTNIVIGNNQIRDESKESISENDSTITSESIKNNWWSSLNLDRWIPKKDSSMIPKDTIYTIYATGFANLTDTDYYVRRLEKETSLTINVVPVMTYIDEIPKSKRKWKQNSKKSSYEFINIGAKFGNSSIDANFINNFLNLGGQELTPDDKTDILSSFKENDWWINNILQKKIGFRKNNFAFSISPELYGELSFPKQIFNFLFSGTRVNAPLDLSNRKNEFQIALPISFSYGKEIKNPLLLQYFDKFSQRTYFGVTAKYILGIVYFESIIRNFQYIPKTDTPSPINVDIVTKYSLQGYYLDTESDPDFNIMSRSKGNSFPYGTGYGFDFGFIFEIDNRITASLAMQNILSHIKWKESTAFEYHIGADATVNMLNNSDSSGEESNTEEADNSDDTSDEEITDITLVETSYPTGSFNTYYPTNLIIGGEYKLNKLILASNLKFSFSEGLGYSKRPGLSIASHYSPIKWFTLINGLSLGSKDKFQWGTGISLEFGFYQFMLGFSQSGGIYNSAKGFSVSLSNAFVF